MTLAFDAVCRQDGDRHCVVVTGELDVYTAMTLRERLLHCIEQGASLLVLDMAGTSFCDSQGISLLIATHWRHPAFYVVAPKNNRVRQVIEICGLQKVLQIVESEQDIPS